MKIIKNKGIYNLEVFPVHKLNLHDTMIVEKNTLEEIIAVRFRVYNAIDALKKNDLNLKYRTRIFTTGKKVGLKICRMK